MHSLNKTLRCCITKNFSCHFFFFRFIFRSIWRIYSFCRTQELFERRISCKLNKKTLSRPPKSIHFNQNVMSAIQSAGTHVISNTISINRNFLSTSTQTDQSTEHRMEKAKEKSTWRWSLFSFVLFLFCWFYFFRRALGVVRINVLNCEKPTSLCIYTIICADCEEWKRRRKKAIRIINLIDTHRSWCTTSSGWR